MTTNELDGDRGRAISRSGPTDGAYDDEISLWPLIRVVWGYRAVIAASVSVALLLFLVWGFSTYAFQPSQRTAGMEFRS